MHPTLLDITQNIAERSHERRVKYLATVTKQRAAQLTRKRLAAANLAHGFAALPNGDKLRVVSEPVPMLGIVSSYNDVLSAHEPMASYPDLIKDEARKHAAVAQFAGGVPAMCDGVTQGQPGMELSLFSRDVIVVVRNQGPRASGMPELHQLTPALSILLDRGHKVALVTDGRMSGASGRVPAAIHVTPESAAGGVLARIQNGDLITVDCETGTLKVHLTEAELAARPLAPCPPSPSGWGRELFASFRHSVTDANLGASVFE